MKDCSCHNRDYYRIKIDQMKRAEMRAELSGIIYSRFEEGYTLSEMDLDDLIDALVNWRLG